MAAVAMGARARHAGAAMNSPRPVVRLRPKQDRRVRYGAPWVFSNEIVMDAAAKTLAPGTLIELASSEGEALASGYFNARSLISVRLLAPPGTEIDAGFLAQSFARALHIREQFYAEPWYRLVNSEGDGLPGLTIDRFGDVCVVQVTSAGMENLLDSILAALEQVIAPRVIVLRNDAPARQLEGLPLYSRCALGDLPRRIEVRENNATYFADPERGQKSGWYYDQRDNRLFMAQLRAATVLDAYCYSGGFAVLCAAMGSKSVTALDSSEPALALAAEAAAANDVGEK